MKIKTKYNVGDMIFFIERDRQVAGVIVRGIRIKVEPKFLSFGNSTTTSINYEVADDVIEEERCFSTKEELLKSL